MSKLDNIIFECVNKAFDGKAETLGDYIDPTKQQIKDLMLDVCNQAHDERGESQCDGLYEFEDKVGEL